LETWTKDKYVEDAPADPAAQDGPKTYTDDVLAELTSAAATPGRQVLGVVFHLCADAQVIWTAIDAVEREVGLGRYDHDPDSATLRPTNWDRYLIKVPGKMWSMNMLVFGPNASGPNAPVSLLQIGGMLRHKFQGAEITDHLLPLVQRVEMILVREHALA
jgi:hypothetical protein